MNNEVHEIINLISVLGKEKRKKATESIKKIIRTFRKVYLKDDSYDAKLVEEYYTSTRFHFTKEEFNSNIAIFEELTCCKKGRKPTDDQHEIVRKVFNESPS